jgi:hypothetical protein
VVENSDSFIEFTVDGVGTGEQLDVVQWGTQVEARARLIAPEGESISGTLEILRNHEVIAGLSYSQLQGEQTLSVFDDVEQSSWYAARTEKSHSGAVFAVLAGAPIRPSVESATYYIDYMDWLENLVLTGRFGTPGTIDETALLSDIAEARGIFVQIEVDAVPEPAGTAGLALGIVALVGLQRRRQRRTRGLP